MHGNLGVSNPLCGSSPQKRKPLIKNNFGAEVLLVQLFAVLPLPKAPWDPSYTGS